MKKSDLKRYDKLARELLDLSNGPVHFGPGYDDVKLHQTLKKAAYAIHKLLDYMEVEERQPMGLCPFNGVCLPLNNTRRIVVNLVEALMGSEDSETLIFSAMEDEDYGGKV